MNINPFQWIESALNSNINKLNRANHLLNLIHYWTDPANKPADGTIKAIRQQIKDHLENSSPSFAIIDEQTISDIAKANERK